MYGLCLEICIGPSEIEKKGGNRNISISTQHCGMIVSVTKLTYLQALLLH